MAKVVEGLVKEFMIRNELYGTSGSGQMPNMSAVADVRESEQQSQSQQSQSQFLTQSSRSVAVSVSSPSEVGGASSRVSTSASCKTPLVLRKKSTDDFDKMAASPGSIASSPTATASPSQLASLSGGDITILGLIKDKQKLLRSIHEHFVHLTKPQWYKNLRC